ncbi:ABC transporter permease [Enterococcus olivae]
MLKYTAKRLVDLIPTLFLVAIIVFAITRMIPGDPASTMLGPQASVEDVNRLREQMGLDEPKLQQFFQYMKELLHFDLGYSMAYRRPVAELIMERFPNTIILTIFSLIVSLLVGVTAGILSAVKKGSIWDYFFTVLSLVGVSIPVFWLGIMLVLLFSVNLGWLPSTGIGNMSNGLVDYLKHLILPGVTLATIPMATFSRITRSSMLEVLEQNYIKTAKAKGLKGTIIVLKHALKNAMTPILTVMGMQISSMLGGAVLTETIYSWPGMGRLIVDAINKRDFVVVQGTVLFLAVLFVLVNLVVDLLYTVVNPKVNLGKAAK